MAIPHVLFDENGNAVNFVAIDPDNGWQAPDGYTLVPDPDGVLWQSATAQPQEPSPPTPDWDTFKRTAISSPEVNQALAAAMPSAPIATNAVTPALMAVADGNPADDFRAVWLTLRRLNLIPQQTLDQLSVLAEKCNLPPDFIRVIGGQS